MYEIILYNSAVPLLMYVKWLKCIGKNKVKSFVSIKLCITMV